MTATTERAEKTPRAVDDIERNKRRKANRQRRLARRRRIMRQLTIAAFVCLTVIVAGTTVFYSIQRTKLSDELEQKKAQLAQLDSEYVSLNARKDNAVDLKYVEQYAENVLGLVKMDRSQQEYLELEKTDQVEVYEGTSGVTKLVSNFVKSFNAIMSFLR